MRASLRKAWLIKLLYGVLLVTYAWQMYLHETTGSHPGRLYYIGTMCCWVAIVWLQRERKPTS